MDRPILTGLLSLTRDIARDADLMERFTMEMLASYPAECQEVYGRMTGADYIITSLMINGTTINVTKAERDAIAACSNKVTAVKQIRSKWGVTLANALKVVEQLEIRWG